MKKILYSLIATTLLLISTKHSFAQKNPDTLVISTKNGRIILVSDSLQKFAPMQTEALIRKALYQVLDSLPNSKELKAKAKSTNDSLYTKIIKKRAFRATEDFGVALIRDKISPVIAYGLEFAPQKQDYFRKKDGMYSFLNLMVSTSFTFREIDGEYQTQPNTFIEFTIGNRMNPDGGKTITELSAGLGYLVQREGNYFGKNTIKLFFNVGMPNSFIKIRPELYFVKKNVFPGLTIKLLNIANYY